MKELAMQKKSFVFGVDDFREIDESMEVSGNGPELVLIPYLVDLVIAGVSMVVGYCTAQGTRNPTKIEEITSIGYDPLEHVHYEKIVDYWDTDHDLQWDKVTTNYIKLDY